MNNISNASFGLVGYEFPDVSMQGANRPVTDTLSINFSTIGCFDEQDGVFELNFVTAVSDKDDSKEPYIKVSCRAKYQFREKLRISDIPEYFYANSIAILFPYVRAYISLLTTQAGQKAVILPTFNLSSLASELKNNTVLKNAEH